MTRNKKRIISTIAVTAMSISFSITAFASSYYAVSSGAWSGNAGRGSTCWYAGYGPDNYNRDNHFTIQRESNSSIAKKQYLKKNQKFTGSVDGNYCYYECWISERGLMAINVSGPASVR